ncbi:hypothetical protein ACFOGI_16705 [Virgibacillus xinjiangensis]|uniref:DUF3887 domain-containing protein n=1 Tax=Virgibacillus xinjiangensis TaxID=393090 RepID=A0ABV7CZR1_9BACI
MRKAVLPLLLSVCILLGGCMNQASARVVEDMYNAALVGNDEYIQGIFSRYDEELDKPMEEVSKDLASQVQHMQGVKNMSIQQLRKWEIQSGVVDRMTEKYEDNWHLIVARLDEDRVNLWTVRKDGYYFIAGCEELRNEEYQQKILK